MSFVLRRTHRSLTVPVPFIVAFNGKTSIPIIQVSLPGDGNPASSAKVGEALSSLRSVVLALHDAYLTPDRDQGYAILGTGQIVHNLRDFSEPGRADLGTALT